MNENLDCPECDEEEGGYLSGNGTKESPWIYECWLCDTQFFPDFTLVNS